MDREMQDRLEEWIPADLTARHEIEAALKDSGWSDSWGPGTVDTVADWGAKQRDIQTPELEKFGRERTTVMGPQDNRQAAIRAMDQTTLGKPENVTFYEDRWGNIMGHNSNTGTRKKVIDSGDR